MKITQTDNHKKLATVKPASTSIGTGSRTVGLTSKIREKKKRGIIASSQKTSIRPNTGTRNSTSGSKTCSGCSRSSRKK